MPRSRGFSSSLAELLWSSWTEGLDPAHRRDFTQIPPRCQEQDRDCPSPATGDEMMGQPQRSCRQHMQGLSGKGLERGVEAGEQSMSLGPGVPGHSSGIPWAWWAHGSVPGCCHLLTGTSGAAVPPPSPFLHAVCCLWPLFLLIPPSYHPSLPPLSLLSCTSPARRLPGRW